MAQAKISSGCEKRQNSKPGATITSQDKRRKSKNQNEENNQNHHKNQSVKLRCQAYRFPKPAFNQHHRGQTVGTGFFAVPLLLIGLQGMTCFTRG